MFLFIIIPMAFEKYLKSSILEVRNLFLLKKGIIVADKSFGDLMQYLYIFFFMIVMPTILNIFPHPKNFLIRSNDLRLFLPALLQIPGKLANQILKSYCERYLWKSILHHQRILLSILLFLVFPADCLHS